VAIFDNTTYQLMQTMKMARAFELQENCTKKTLVVTLEIWAPYLDVPLSPPKSKSNIYLLLDPPF
jgi:hypothetical protein